MAGSIQERGNGSYFLTVSAGFKADGKRNRKTRTVQAKNITEARKKLAAFVVEVEAGEYVAPSHIKLPNMLRLGVRMQERKFRQKRLKHMIMY